MLPQIHRVLGSLQIDKYQNLIKNFRNQEHLPTGKHHLKSLLIDVRNLNIKDFNAKELIEEIFENTMRIRKISCYDELGFVEPKESGKYIIIEFNSFSAAKKTL